MSDLSKLKKAGYGQRYSKSDRAILVGKKKITIILLLVLITVSIVFFRDFINEKSEKEVDGMKDAVSTPIDLDKSQIRATGYLFPARTATVSSETISKIESVLVVVGQKVKKGDRIAILDNFIQESRMMIAEKKIHSKRTNINLLKSDLKELERLYKRDLKLKSEGFLTKDDIKKSEFSIEQVKYKINLAHIDLESQELELELAKKNYDRTIIRAPFDGVVTEINANAGEVISPTSSGVAFTRTGIATVTDNSNMFVEVELNETMIPKILTTKFAKIEIMEQSFDGEILHLPFSVDKNTGTGVARLRVIDPSAIMLPNMKVNVFFKIEN